MNPEPLINKKFEISIVGQFNAGGCVIYDEDDIKSACNFYRKYVSRPDLLAEEHPELAKIEIDYESADDVLKEIKRIEDVYGINGTQATIRAKLMDYNLWLFKLAFKDVFGDKTVGGEN